MVNGNARRSIVRKRKRVFRKRVGRRGVTPSFKRKVKAAIQSVAEHKYMDLSGLTGSFGNDNFEMEPVVSQGSTDHNREGDRILIRSLKAAFLLYPSLTYATFTSYLTCRILVYSYRGSTGVPALSSVLEQSTTVAQSLTSAWNRFNVAEKIIIPMVDKIVQFTPNVTNYNKMLKFNFFGKRYPHKNAYFDSTGAREYRTIFHIVTDAVSSGVNISYYSRMTFTDV